MKKIHYRSPLILQTLIWLPTQVILRFFGHFEVRGLENIAELIAAPKRVGDKNNAGNYSRRRGVIFASNHSSELDPIILPAGLPFLSPLMPIFYASREKEFYKNSGILQLIYGGWFFRLWGAYPVQTGLKNYEKSLKYQIKILSEGRSVMIFPEGGINREGVGLSDKVKGGIGFLALETGCPVVPIGISGAYQMKVSEFFGRRRKIVLTIGKPVFASELLLHEFEKKDIAGAPASGSELADSTQSIETYKEIAGSLMDRVRPLL